MWLILFGLKIGRRGSVRVRGDVGGGEINNIILLKSSIDINGLGPARKLIIFKFKI